MLTRDDQTLRDSAQQQIGAKLWRPVRPIIEVDTSADQVTNLQSKVQPPQTPGISTPQIFTGAPDQLLSITATESPSKQQDRVFSLVSVTFIRDGADKSYGSTRIYLRGYKGNTNAVLQAEGRDGPINFLLETTNETITVIGVPVGLDGTPAPINLAASTTVLLDGVISAPPAPTISQALLTITVGGTTMGQQFGFNFLGGIVSDVIDGYWIYKVAAHSAPTPPASRFKYVKHNPQASGAYTFQDISGVSTNFYYVSAVNNAGMESSLTDSGAGGGVGSVTSSYRPSSSSGTDYTPASNAYDGNEALAAEGNSNDNSITTTWLGLPVIVGVATAVTLKIISAASSVYDPPIGKQPQ